MATKSEEKNGETWRLEMLPSRVMIAAEQARCEKIVSEEWARIVKEYQISHIPSGPTEAVVSRILQRIRRVE